jgi:hypothetical protein
MPTDPTAPTTLAVYQADLTPLRGRWGQAWAYALGAAKDTTVERARQAVLAGAVTRAPVDALPYLGEDAGGLERYPIDDDDTYRARIASAWELWPWAGTRHALEVVFGLLNPEGSTRIATARELGRAPWAQWWAFVSQPSPIGLRYWGAGTWGSGVWGSLATRHIVRAARRFARQFSNARDRGWAVVLHSTPGVWGGGVWGAGTWGGPNTRWRI